MLSEREQVDEAFVRDCKDQLVEANLLAQDLRAELKTQLAAEDTGSSFKRLRFSYEPGV